MKKTITIGLLIAVLFILPVNAVMPASQDIVCCYDAQDEQGNIDETHLSTEECSEFELDKDKCLAIIGIQSGRDYLDITYGENPCSTEAECREFCDVYEVNEAECFGIMQKWVKEEPVEDNDIIQTILLIAAALVIIWSIYKFVHVFKKRV